MTPSIAAGRAGKARLFEHRDVRVRAGARPARSTGKFQRHDVAEIVMPAPMALVTFPERKVTRAWDGTKKDIDVVFQSVKAAHYVRHPHPPFGHHGAFGHGWRLSRKREKGRSRAKALDPGFRRDDELLAQCPVAVLVLLARTARARLVAADLGAFAHHR